MTILQRLFGKLAGQSKPAHEAADIVSLPPGIAGPMVGLVKGIGMSPMPITPEISGRFIEKADPTIRSSLAKLQAAQDLTPAGIASTLLVDVGPGAIRSVAALLGSADRSVGRMAGDICVAFGIDSVPHVLRPLNARDIDSRNDAAACLLRLASKTSLGPQAAEAIEGLSAIIRTESLSHWDVIVIGAAALAAIGQDALPELERLLRYEEYLVRLAAVAGLLRLGGQAAPGILRAARQAECNFSVAEGIDEALAETERG